MTLLLLVEEGLGFELELDFPIVHFVSCSYPQQMTLPQ